MLDEKVVKGGKIIERHQSSEQAHDNLHSVNLGRNLFLVKMCLQLRQLFANQQLDLVLPL